MKPIIIESMNFIVNQLLVFAGLLVLLELLMPGFVVYYINMNILLVACLTLKAGYWLYQY